MRPLVVFDLDGTLVDSRLDLAESTNEMLTSFGAAELPVDHIVRMVGEGARVLVERALGAAGVGVDVDAALDRFRSIYDRRLLIHTRPYPGIPEVVEQLAADFNLAVLTNKPEAPSRRLLEAFGLERHIRAVIGGDSGPARKPSPEGLELLIRQFGGSRAYTWLVGDSMIDVETARRAGVRMCVCLYGFGQFRGELRLKPDELTVRSSIEIPRTLGSPDGIPPC